MVIKVVAKILSLVFHPLLLATYGLLLMLAVHPYPFGVNRPGELRYLILMTFNLTFFLPALAATLMKLTGLLSSLEMPDQKERIGPYIAAGVLYLWLFITVLYNPNLPLLFKSFLLGGIIGLFLAFLINIFEKVSVHAAGMGGMLAMVFIMIATYYHGAFGLNLPLIGPVTMTTTQVLMFAIIAAGAVGSSRLILKAHEPQQVYGGYLVGIFAQLLAYQIMF